jgi:hypothetical protein
MAEDNLDFLFGKRPPTRNKERERAAELDALRSNAAVAQLRTEARRLDAENRRLIERVRTLTMENAGLGRRPRPGDGMSFETMSAIAKCLHPDASPSEEERTSAFKLFSAWRVVCGLRIVLATVSRTISSIINAMTSSSSTMRIRRGRARAR